MRAAGRLLAPASVTTTVANYLANPNFEGDTNGDGIADSWLEEHSTATKATYTLTSTGAVDGGTAQRMQYTGEGTNNGGQKVEFYQATAIGSFNVGDPATFEVWLSGALTNAFCQIVIEAHTGSTYLAEVSQTAQLTANPQPFRLTYPFLPSGTDSVVVVVICPELLSTSQVDVRADKASVVKAVKPALTHRINLMTNPSFELDTSGLPSGGFSQANSTAGAPTYTYPTTSVPRGSKRLNIAYTGVGETNGTRSLQLITGTTANGTFAPGNTASFSADVFGTLTGCNLQFRIQFMTSAGGSAGTSDSANLTVTTTSTRLSYSAVAPSTTAAARVLIRVLNIGTGDVVDLSVDGLLLENSTTVGSYFDGSMSGYEWLGTANASTSRDLITV